MPGGGRYTFVKSSARVLTRLDLLYRSPTLLILALATSVLVSNVAVAAALARFEVKNHLVHHLFDSIMLVTLLIPALIFFVFRPVRLHVAERGCAETELVAERNKLLGILDAMPVGTCIVNRCGIEYANRTLLKELGPTQGLSCREYFKGLPGACANCVIRIGGGKSVTWEATSGSDRVYEIFETPLQNSDGTTSKLAMVQDITSRKVAEYELRASRQQLRSLSVHQQQTREEERAAISREIHDELGQVLATVQLGVSSLAVKSGGHAQLNGKIAAMEQLLTSASKTVQRISTQLRPAILDELGLAEAIEWQATEFRATTGIACTSDVLLSETNINRDLSIAVFRIFQEALTNVIRHSGANRVAVSVEERSGRIVLRVADNGCGITLSQTSNSRSLGITGMRERALALGGRVRHCRLRPQGTVVIAYIPLDSSPGVAS
jgi:signal transduction histidine kinase